jgi:NAD(P)-dependent dehydrogenase (short-subunit alcohol dehydrogenase family)
MMKTILVVGGSRGIGKEVVKRLLPENKVVSISREASDLDHVNLTQIELDAVKGELPELDEVDGLVYCPGTINLKPFSRLSEEDFLNDFEINVLGAVRVLKAYEKALKKSDQASVVLFSTVASDMGMTFHASVAISKSGVEGLAKSLAAEWAPKIRVNVIAPTITDTTLASKILRNDAIREKMKERHPLNKILDPTEVAELAVYLLSNGSRSITGQVLKMDAGMLSIKV